MKLTNFEYFKHKKRMSIDGMLGWRENGRGKKMGGEKMERKENGRENVIPHHAWMDEGK